jgi:hypothetical protein
MTSLNVFLVLIMSISNETRNESTVNHISELSLMTSPENKIVAESTARSIGISTEKPIVAVLGALITERPELTSTTLSEQQNRLKAAVEFNDAVLGSDQYRNLLVSTFSKLGVELEPEYLESVLAKYRVITRKSEDPEAANLPLLMKNQELAVAGAMQNRDFPLALKDMVGNQTSDESPRRDDSFELVKRVILGNTRQNFDENLHKIMEPLSKGKEKLGGWATALTIAGISIALPILEIASDMLPSLSHLTNHTLRAAFLSNPDLVSTIFGAIIVELPEILGVLAMAKGAKSRNWWIFGAGAASYLFGLTTSMSLTQEFFKNTLDNAYAFKVLAGDAKDSLLTGAFSWFLAFLTNVGGDKIFTKLIK